MQSQIGGGSSGDGFGSVPGSGGINYGASGGTPRSTGASPGYTPDYANLIYGDPGYMALKAAMDSSLAAFNSQMRGQIQQDVLNSGYAIPSALGFLTKAQIEEAKNNPYSQAALAAKGHDVNLRAIQNQLAARGGFNSGELPYGLGHEGDRYNMQTQSNEAALANEIRNLIGQQAQLKSTWMAQLAAGLGAAMQNQMALHPYISPTPGQNIPTAIGWNGV